jgi:MFS family permease
LTSREKSRFSNPFAEFPREVGVLVFASFFVAVGFGIIAPTLPLFARSFGVNNAQVGSILSAFAFARFASGLISGKLVDIFGERLVYTVGIAFVSALIFCRGFLSKLRTALDLPRSRWAWIFNVLRRSWFNSLTSY